MACGLAPVTSEDAAFTELDVESFRTFAAGAALFGERAVLQLTRVLGESVARVAEAALALFIANVELPAREKQASSLALAQANLTATQSLTALPSTLEAFLRAHLEAAMRRQRMARGS